MAAAGIEVESGGMTRTLKDLGSGAAGGIAQVLLGILSISILSAWVVVFTLVSSSFVSWFFLFSRLPSVASLSSG
jgi:glycerate kinase